MKKYIRFIFIFIGVITTLMLNGCSEDFPEREPSYVPGENIPEVYFPADNEYDVEVEPTATGVDVSIARKNTSGAVSVNISKVDTADVFSVPDNVEFADGEELVTFTVEFSNLKAFETYALELFIDEELTNPYTTTEGTNNFKLFVVQSDWVDFAVGSYYSDFFVDTWDQVLQYSEILDRYRFPDLWVSGVDYEFNWDGESEISAIAEVGNKVVTGYEHPTYGMVSATTDYDNSSYDQNDQMFTFVREWTVSAGSFGEWVETYTITEFY
jgi:hypothetical protein